MRRRLHTRRTAGPTARDPSGLAARGTRRAGGPRTKRTSGPGTRKDSCPGTKRARGPGTRKDSCPGIKRASGPGTRKDSCPGTKRTSGPGTRKDSCPRTKRASGPGTWRVSSPSRAAARGKALHVVPHAIMTASSSSSPRTLTSSSSLSWVRSEAQAVKKGAPRTKKASLPPAFATYRPRTCRPRTYRPRTYQPRTYRPRTYRPRTYRPRMYQPRTRALSGRQSLQSLWKCMPMIASEEAMTPAVPGCVQACMA